MKKQFTILIPLFFNCIFAWSQDRYIKTTIPCDNELLKKTPGRWMTIGGNYDTKTTKQQRQEIVNRLNAIHQLAVDIYPSPMAFDAKPWFSIYDKEFGSQLKIEKTQYGPSESYVNGISTVRYGYSVKFCDYFCGRNEYEIIRGAGCEAGTSISVHMNDLSDFFWRLVLTDFYLEIMRIDNRPIRMMPVLKEKKWKGYDVYSPQTGSGINMVLLHREGILPFIPVTRKQYLDRCIESLQLFFNKDIIPFEKREGLALLMKKEEWDAQIKKQEKFRDDVLKYYRDELEATTRAGMLDSPAIITGFMDMLPTQPIFTTQAKGGNMLVTENPVYFKKDLPKYIPQLMVYSMWDAADGPDPALNPYKLYEKNFPIEKLQAMIDK